MRGSSIKQMPNWAVGLIAVVLLSVASFVAFTKKTPWGGGTEYVVVFDSAQNVRPNSPVRIAGVNVGKVTEIKALPGAEDASTTAQSTEGTEGAGTASPQAATAVTLEFQDEGLPLKEDATFKLRPRLFLEGNLFVEVTPGSPAAPEADEGHSFPPSQTSNSVQLDEVFTGSLQKDARRDLQTFLDQFGTALIDGGGAKSFRTLYKTSRDAFKFTSQVNEATLGLNEGDLSGLIKNLDKVLRGLARNETALQDTVTNLRIFTGSLAAQDQALEQAIIELPQVLDAAQPALANLNESFPPLRAFAREALPGTRSAPDAIEAATPLFRQIRLLSRPAELRGLVDDLEPAIPDLAKLAKRQIPFLEEGRALASCFNNVIIPWSNDSVEGQGGYIHNGPTGDNGQPAEVYKETAYGLVGIAGESRSQDANGQYIRIAGGGGTNSISTELVSSGEEMAGTSQFPLLGAMPALNDSAKTPFRPDEPCENQDPPDLRADGGVAPAQSTTKADAKPVSGEVADIVDQSEKIFKGLTEAQLLKRDGDKGAARQVQKSAEKDLRKFYKRFRD